MKNITTVSQMPKELEKALVEQWKWEMLGIQPERSKREDHHLNLDSYPDHLSASELRVEMEKVEMKIVDAVL